MQVPRKISAPTLLLVALIAIFASNFNYLGIQYQPLFLLICGFGSWFVGIRYGISLLFFVFLVEAHYGKVNSLDDLTILSAVDIGVSLGSAAALVLMLGVARQALEIEWRFARVDALTGAMNRKAFFEAVEADAEQGDVAVLIFADVNGLKQLNDKFGHKAGDDALRDFANRTRKAIRKRDLFARIGGDEFVVFLKVRDREAASMVAERLNNSLNVELEEGAGQPTCSLGVLVLLEGSKSIDEELRQADALMYYAKKSGLQSIMAISINGKTQFISPITSPNTPNSEARVIRELDRKFGELIYTVSPLGAVSY